MHRAHEAGGMGIEFFSQVRDEFQRIWELRREETLQGLRVFQGAEAGLALPGQEQGDGEAAVQVRQGDEHVAAPGPDVQGFLLHPVLPSGAGGDGELLVGMGQDVLPHLHAAMLHQRLAHGGAAAVGGDDGGGADVHALASLVHQSQLAALEIHVLATPAEVDAGTSPLGRVHEQHVESRPRHGMDDFRGGAAIEREARASDEVVQHAAAHGDEQLLHFSIQTHGLQGAYATVGQGQVDGAAGGDRMAAHIRQTLVDFDGEAAARQEHRQ